MPLIHRSTFSFGPDGETVNDECNSIDFSLFESLLWEVVFTTMNTDAGDTLNIRLQSTSDRVQWHTRARMIEFLGTGDPDATGPEYYRMTVRQLGETSADEEGYEPSGSESATDVSAGMVRNGPFPGKYRSVEFGLQPNWRIRSVLVDANSNASFIGEFRIWGVGMTY